MKPCFRKIDGFTLLELIASMAIASLVVVVLASLFHLSIASVSKMDREDAMFMDGGFTLEYMKKEIRKADEIQNVNLSQLPLKFPQNMGFVLINRESTQNQYILYYLHDTTLRRFSSRTRKSLTELGYATGETGYNNMIDNVSSIANSSYDESIGLLTLSLEIESGGRTVQYQTKIHTIEAGGE